MGVSDLGETDSLKTLKATISWHCPIKVPNPFVRTGSYS